MLLFLQDSLGGNAKTYIIANVHPGSKCFGETLSTLHFAQRAKLIKNKVYQNETHNQIVFKKSVTDFTTENIKRSSFLFCPDRLSSMRTLREM